LLPRPGICHTHTILLIIKVSRDFFFLKKKTTDIECPSYIQVEFGFQLLLLLQEKTNPMQVFNSLERSQRKNLTYSVTVSV